MMFEPTPDSRSRQVLLPRPFWLRRSAACSGRRAAVSVAFGQEGLRLWVRSVQHATISKQVSQRQYCRNRTSCWGSCGTPVRMITLKPLQIRRSRLAEHRVLRWLPRGMPGVALHALRAWSGRASPKVGCFVAESFLCICQPPLLLRAPSRAVRAARLRKPPDTSSTCRLIVSVVALQLAAEWTTSSQPYGLFTYP